MVLIRLMKRALDQPSIRRKKLWTTTLNVSPSSHTIYLPCCVDDFTKTRFILRFNSIEDDSTYLPLKLMEYITNCGLTGDHLIEGELKCVGNMKKMTWFCARTPFTIEIVEVCGGVRTSFLEEVTNYKIEINRTFT